MSRLEVMLGTLLAITVLAVGILAGVVFLFPDAPAAEVASAAVAPTADPAGVGPANRLDTAVTGYATAQRTAEAWSGDALLVSVTATWTPGESADSAVNLGASSWGYTFYSAAAERVIVITVDAVDGHVVYELPAARPPAPLPPGNWRQDSDAVLATLLAAGGEQFLRQDGDATLTMTLAMNEAAGRPEWFVSLISGRTGRSLTLLLDAGSGEILELEGDPT